MARGWNHRPGPCHAVNVAEGAADLVGLGQVAAGEERDDLDDLLVEDHHPAGLGQDRTQVVVEVGGHPPALLGLEVRRDHVALDRTGPEQRDVGDHVLEASRPDLPTSSRCPGDSIWKHPRVLDELMSS